MKKWVIGTFSFFFREHSLPQRQQHSNICSGENFVFFPIFPSEKNQLENGNWRLYVVVLAKLDHFSIKCLS